MIFAATTQATPYSGYTAGGILEDLQFEPTRKITTARKVSGASEQDTADKVTLSEDGLRRSHGEQQAKTADANQLQAPEQVNDNTSATSEKLSTEEQQAVQKLKIRDAEVKAHEQAHLANAGQYAAGGPSYSYQTGPDGRRYAVGGEVPIDVSKEKNPEQTVQKMRVVRRAALAPAHPSSADRRIAAAASMKESQAIQEMRSEERSEEPTGTQIDSAGTSTESAPAEKKGTSRV